MPRSNSRILGILTAFLVVSIAVAAFFWVRGSLRNAEDQPKTIECRTQAPSLEVQQTIDRLLAKKREEVPAERPAGSVTIPVYFHVITNANESEGNVTDAEINDQIAVLNAAFSGTGPGGTGADTPFTFSLVGIDRTANDEWFNMSFDGVTPSKEEIVAKATLKRGDKSTLNIYTARLADGALGWARWPWDVATAACLDGVVLRYSTLPGGVAPSVDATPLFDEGDTATHEVGHWLGLFHTYQGKCIPPGDSVDDTPFHKPPAIAVGCDSFNTCQQPGGDPKENFMNKTNDSCMFKFTAGQSDRMDVMHLLYRT